MNSLIEIKKQLTDEWMTNATVQEKFGFVPGTSFDSVFAPVSVVNIVFYVVAYGLFLFTQVLASSKLDIVKVIDTMKPHSVAWYIGKIKAFQIGDVLGAFEDVYSTIDESKKVVKYCNINEQRGYLAIKIAGETAGVPSVLPEATLNAVIAYMNRVKDAGVHYNIISLPADLYRVNLRIYYDSLVLNGEGKRIDQADDEPVKKAIERYLKSMPFDARYSNMALVDAVQNVEGIKIVDNVLAESKYGNNAWTEIVSVLIPSAGYMALDSLNVEYIAY